MFRRLATFAASTIAVVGLGWAITAGLAQSTGPASSAGSGSETPASGDAPAFVLPRSGPFAPEQIAIPNAAAIAAWSRSGHSNSAAEAFSHWNKEGAIPPVCATCHSGIGFRSLYGLDGSEKGPPEEPVQVGGVVDCDTCHNPNIGTVTEVALPSGAIHPVIGGEAPCLTCHQGRTAGTTVVKAVTDKPDDAPDAELRFINPHYVVAAATWLGGYGALGYHYPAKSYSGRFAHAKPVATCVSCHDPHSLQVAEETCLTCHDSSNATDIRISRQSYDGSGDTTKGIYADIRANSERLKTLLLDYAAKVAGTPMIYDGSRYPYFFADANGDGLADQSDGSPTAYNAWTPRLLKATYNWKFVNADPGIHVHNPHYALELLYDSIEDLSEPVGVDMGSLNLLR
jgi:hypothetical protein